MNKQSTKAEILKRAKSLPPPKTTKEAEQIINDATELWFLNRLIDHNAMQLRNTRMSVKNLMKEKQLLISIKKKWVS